MHAWWGHEDGHQEEYPPEESDDEEEDGEEAEESNGPEVVWGDSWVIWVQIAIGIGRA